MPSILRPFSNIVAPGKLQVPTGDLSVDWNHRLSRNLIGAYLPGVMGPVDVSGQGPTLTPDTATGTLGMDPEGPGLTSTAANQNYTGLATSAFKTGAEFTVYWRGFVIGNSSNSCGIIGITFDNASGSPFVLWELAAGGSGTTVSGVQLNYNVGGVFVQTGLSVLTAGSIYGLCGTFSVIGNLAALYVNGVSKSTNTVGSGPNSSATSLIEICTYGGAKTRFANAICTCAYFWNRALSAEEVLVLEQAPYDFLIPAEYDLPAIRTAAAPTVKNLPPFQMWAA